MSIIIKELTYFHADKESLFEDISFSLEKGEKAALIGNNGTGKSTLFRLITKELSAPSGEIFCSSTPYYVPQHFGQYDRFSVAEALQIDKKLQALCAILSGDVSSEHYTALNDDWNVEERIRNALSHWDLANISASQKLETLSGGEKTRLFLAGIELHHPEIILLDEPSNHLDWFSRKKLYELLQNSKATILVISHDRTLLNLLPAVYELRKNGAIYYSGNYLSYKAQKEQEINSLNAKIGEEQKMLRLARKTARETAERKQKLEARGEKRSSKQGVGRMAMNTLRDKAEKSGAKLKEVHHEKIDAIKENLAELRAVSPDLKAMKPDLKEASLHRGKTLLKARALEFSYGEKPLWAAPLNFLIKSGDRVAIMGRNGSGKTTLIRLMLGILEPTKGAIERADFKCLYLDQEYAMIKNELTVFEQISRFNSVLQDHELKAVLSRFLFSYEMWNKPCTILSGGEKMKLSLACLTVDLNVPDVLVLDEPTNNIDIQNIEILTETVKDFNGTILLISHDQYFVEQIGIDYTISTA